MEWMSVGIGRTSRGKLSKTGVVCIWLEKKRNLERKSGPVINLLRRENRKWKQKNNHIFFLCERMNHSSLSLHSPSQKTDQGHLFWRSGLLSPRRQMNQFERLLFLKSAQSLRGDKVVLTERRKCSLDYMGTEERESPKPRSGVNGAKGHCSLLGQPGPASLSHRPLGWQNLEWGGLCAQGGEQRHCCVGASAEVSMPQLGLDKRS